MSRVKKQVFEPQGTPSVLMFPRVILLSTTAHSRQMVGKSIGKSMRLAHTTSIICINGSSSGRRVGITRAGPQPPRNAGQGGQRAQPMRLAYMPHRQLGNLIMATSQTCYFSSGHALFTDIMLNISVILLLLRYICQ